MQNNAISKIGVEIEGAWEDISRLRVDSRAIFKNDSSVSISDYSFWPEGPRSKGEIAGPAFDKLSDLLKWMDIVYPNVTNASCGLHIHISMLCPEHYALLMEPEFFIIFTAEMRKWGSCVCSSKSSEDENFWHRALGRNNYCSRLYDAQSGVVGSGYRGQLNYGAYCRHKTLECRAFPAFNDKNKAIEAVKFFYNLVNNYIANIKPTNNTSKFLELMKARPSKVLEFECSQPKNTLSLGSVEFEYIS